MGVLTKVRQAIMRRNSYYIATIIAGAFVAEIAVDTGVNALWEHKNRGVRIVYDAIVSDWRRNCGNILSIVMWRCNLGPNLAHPSANNKEGLSLTYTSLLDLLNSLCAIGRLFLPSRPPQGEL